MAAFHCRGKIGLYTVAMRTATLILLMAAIACWAIGCNSRTEPKPEPVNQPQPTPEPAKPEPAGDKHRFADWLAVSPMKTDMRSMWLSAGLINANAGGYRATDFDALESNADNIATKAGKFAGMWDVIRQRNRDLAVKAKAGNWDDARISSQRVYTSCQDCHVDTWSPHTRGVLPASIDTWLENGNAAENVKFSGLNLTSTDAYLKLMFRMVQYLDRTIGGVDNKNLAEVLKWTKSLDEAVAEQLELWRTVERAARQIAEIASRTDTTGVEAQYTKMITACITCHATYVPDEREPKNPPPWKQRGR